MMQEFSEVKLIRGQRYKTVIMVNRSFPQSILNSQMFIPHNYHEIQWIEGESKKIQYLFPKKCQLNFYKKNIYIVFLLIAFQKRRIKQPYCIFPFTLYVSSQVTGTVIDSAANSR